MSPGDLHGRLHPGDILKNVYGRRSQMRTILETAGGNMIYLLFIITHSLLTDGGILNGELRSPHFFA
jgi:hypothetical protein